MTSDEDMGYKKIRRGWKLTIILRGRVQELTFKKICLVGITVNVSVDDLQVLYILSSDPHLVWVLLCVALRPAACGVHRVSSLLSQLFLFLSTLLTVRTRSILPCQPYTSKSTPISKCTVSPSETALSCSPCQLIVSSEGRIWYTYTIGVIYNRYIQ